jgi:adenylate cyclase
MLTQHTRSLLISITMVILAGILVNFSRLGNGLERLSFDLLFVFRPLAQTEEIVIVYLDETAHKQLKQPLDRIWDRRLHASLLDKFTRQKANLVIYDILFDVASSDKKADAAFEAAIKRSGRVILGASVKAQRNMGVIERAVAAPLLTLREPTFGWGLLTLDPVDPDFGVRRMNLGSGDIPIKNASWLAAEELRRQKGQSASEIPDRELWINYLGPPGTVDSISFSQALDDEGVPEDYFTGKTVLIGGKYATGFSGDMRDSFLTPYSLRGHPFAPGVEVHANVLSNLVKGDWLVRTGAFFDLLVVVILAAAFVASFYYIPLKVTIFLALLYALVFGSLSIWICCHQLIFFNWLMPLTIQLPLALLISTIQRYYVAASKERKLISAFSSYISPVIAEKVAKSGFDLTPGGEMKPITVMFTDLQGYTSLSEHTNPEELGRVLNAYFEMMTKDVLETHGTVIKYIGDAVFAIWGAPLEDENKADHAVHAASTMIHTIRSQKIYGHTLTTRVGISSGECLVGNLGSTYRFDYTALGDAVNLSSRIEGFNKYLGTSILIDQDTLDQTSESFNHRPVGRFQLLGKKDSVPLYEVLVDCREGEPWIESFSLGLDAFQAGDFEEARQGFEQCQTQRGGDGPSQYYLKILQTYRNSPPDMRRWNGDVIVDSK